MDGWMEAMCEWMDGWMGRTVGRWMDGWTPIITTRRHMVYLHKCH